MVLLFFVFVGNSYAIENDSVRANSMTHDQWFSADKGRHLIGSMCTTILLTKVCDTQFKMSNNDARVVGISVSFTLGIGKELIDQRRHNNFFSWKDLTADIVGITLGILLLGIK